MYPEAPAGIALSDPRSSTGSLMVATAPSLPPDANEHRERLRVGFTFSRRFIITYQAVLVGILLLIVVQQCAQKWLHYRRRQSRKAEYFHHVVNPEQHYRDTAEEDRATLIDDHTSSSASSSSSSCDELHVVSNGTKGVQTSSRALLPKDFEAQPANLPYNATVLSRTQALLMYQPPPLPLFRRTMPTIGTCLGVLALFGLNVFYLLYRCSDQFDVLAARAGNLFVANLPWLYLFAAKNQPIKLLTGYSYENLNLIHRRLGEWMCFLALIHGSGLIYAWYTFLRPLGYTLWHFLTLRYVLFGIGAFFAYEALYLTSLSSLRSWWYEVFLGSHIILQAAALILLWLHHYSSRPYTAVSAFIFVVDRILYRVILKTRSFRAELSVLEDANTTLVSISVPLRSGGQLRWLRNILGHSLKQGWQPSHHVFISVPALSRKHALQSHPMTIASASPSSLVAQQDAHVGRLDLLIRAQGGFSRDLLNFAHKNATTMVRLDGPYGSLHALEMLQSADRAIIVAGGSGIAVANPMLWALIESRIHMSSVTPELGSTDYASFMPKEIRLIWIVQEASHVQWLNSFDLETLQKHGVQVVIPAPTKTAGRPDVEILIRDALVSAKHTARSQNTTREDISVVVSGPDGLNRSVQNSCAKLRKRGVNIRVAVEKFGW